MVDERRIVRRLLHYVTEAQRWIDGLATVLEKLDRKAAEALTFPTLTTRLLQRRLPMSGL